jgi:hypothetical protein
MEPWARERVASGVAASVPLYDVPQTEWPIFSAVFFLNATEALAEQGVDVRYAMPSVEAARDLIMDPLHHTWVRTHWGSDYLHDHNVFFRSLLIAGLTSYEALTRNGRDVAFLRDQVETLAADLDASPHGVLEGLPGRDLPHRRHGLHRLHPARRPRAGHRPQRVRGACAARVRRPVRRRARASCASAWISMATRHPCPTSRAVASATRGWASMRPSSGPRTRRAGTRRTASTSGRTRAGPRASASTHARGAARRVDLRDRRGPGGGRLRHLGQRVRHRRGAPQRAPGPSLRADHADGGHRLARARRLAAQPRRPSRTHARPCWGRARCSTSSHCSPRPACPSPPVGS